MFSSKKKSVLVIDDDKIQCSIVKARLGKQDGFDIHTTLDGKSGLKFAQKKKPDLILLDWMMPKMDGIEVLKELKANSDTKSIPVFMFTAKNMMGDVQDATDLGAVGYFTKPIDLALLSTRVIETLGA